MTTVFLNELIEVFRDKLAQTGSMDLALLKCVWIAYQRGIESGREEEQLRQKREQSYD